MRVGRQVFFEAFAPVQLKRMLYEVAELQMPRTQLCQGLGCRSITNLVMATAMVGVAVSALIVPQAEILWQVRPMYLPPPRSFIPPLPQPA